MTGAYRERSALPFVPRVSKVVPRHIQYRFTYVSAGPSLLVTIKEACRVAYWQDVGPSARLPAKSLPLGPSGPSEYVASATASMFHSGTDVCDSTRKPNSGNHFCQPDWQRVLSKQSIFPGNKGRRSLWVGSPAAFFGSSLPRPVMPRSLKNMVNALSFGAKRVQYPALFSVC